MGLSAEFGNQAAPSHWIFMILGAASVMDMTWNLQLIIANFKIFYTFKENWIIRTARLINIAKHVLIQLVICNHIASKIVVAAKFAIIEFMIILALRDLQIYNQMPKSADRLMGVYNLN